MNNSDQNISPNPPAPSPDPFKPVNVAPPTVAPATPATGTATAPAPNLPPVALPQSQPTAPTLFSMFSASDAEKTAKNSAKTPAADLPQFQRNHVNPPPAVAAVQKVDTSQLGAPNEPTQVAGTCKPDGVIFVAVLMLIPLFFVLQFLYLSSQDVASFMGISALESASFSDLDNILSIFSWATLAALSLGAILLLAVRRKFARVIAIFSLLMAAACLIKPIWDSVETYTKYQDTKSAYSALYGNLPTTETAFDTSEKTLQLLILNEVVLFILPILATIYLSKPHVKRAYS